MTSGQVYTWHIYFSGSINTGWISFANNNPYAGGYGYYCCSDYTYDDFLFKIQGDDIFSELDDNAPTVGFICAKATFMPMDLISQWF